MPDTIINREFDFIVNAQGLNSFVRSQGAAKAKLPKEVIQYSLEVAAWNSDGYTLLFVNSGEVVTHMQFTNCRTYVSSSQGYYTPRGSALTISSLDP